MENNRQNISMQAFNENKHPFFGEAELSVLDLMTIRDLCKLGGYQNDLPLSAVLMAMFFALQEGSLCLNIDKSSLSDKLQLFMESKKAKQISDKFLYGLAENRYNNLIARNIDTYLPLIAYESKEKKLLYFQKFFFHETRLKHRLRAFLRANEPCKLSGEKENEILREPVEKDQDQIKAIRLALGSQFAIISGGPGTGKTFVMVNILRCFVRAGVKPEQIILAAPTGRAAQRMTEAIHSQINSIENPCPEDIELLKMTGSTLHRILRYKTSSHDFHYRDTNPLPASVVIVDEVSMVDVVMMERFLRAIDPAKTRLVLLGDKDQLPSVEAGAVFAEMIPEETEDNIFKDRLVVLKKVYRSGANLLRLAKQVNEGKFPECLPISLNSALLLKEDNWAFVLPDDNINKWKKQLRLWVEHHYLGRTNKDNKSYKELILEAVKLDADSLAYSDDEQNILDQIFSKIEKARILTLLRKGVYGCSWINSIIAQYLSFELEPLTRMHNNIFSGAVIMITQNDYSKKLFNGDVGVIIKSVDGNYRVFFKRFGSYIFFDMDLLSKWELGFAVTVHKSQGTEFDDVLLVLPDNESHRLLTREIIYTGITRAKKRVILYGIEPAFKSALQRKIERESGLTW
ncbi:MAG: exodeoxyribonuclease V subunit alpha [Desulfobacterales bacterium]|nr:exodeoxyribonuclease V subunit alpha [Desulfobacterales bacterium]